MIQFLILGFVAAASAAPHYYSGHHRRPFHHHYPSRYSSDISDEIFGEHLFDTRRFWSELSHELMEIDHMLQNFHQHFPSIQSNTAIENGKYKITIPLTGFDEKDIIVKVKDEILMVQAVHKMDDKSGNERHYMDVRTLPTNIKIEGSTYSYDNEILTIEFDLKDKTEVGIEENTETEVKITEAPIVDNKQSREEMEEHGNDNVRDVEVGPKKDDSIDSKENELLTNEIPGRNRQVEATTYPVDLKDEVEFVPVPY